MKILLKNGSVINENGDVYKADILIVDSMIAEVAENISESADKTVDCTGKFITPGFASMHNHSPMNIFKGIAEDVHIDDWFNKELWPYESKMQDNDIYWGAKLSCAEMVNNGITCFADHYFKGELIAKAAKEIGIKADIAYTIYGFSGDCTDELAVAEKFISDFKDDGYIAPRLGPHSPYLNSPAVLKQISDKAKELGVGVHIHVSETEIEVKQSRENHGGKTPFEVCRENGIFDVPCIVGHGLWIEEDDIKYLNSDTVFAVSPKTYMKLGMGEGNLWKYADKLNLAAGNDGCASSNSVDVLEQIRLFALVGKFKDNARGFTLKQIWKLLMNGHKYLSFNSGVIAKGYSADLNIFDLNTLSASPVYNPLAAIIYSAVPSVNITDVIISGKFVKENGKLSFDEKEIIKNAQECAKEIYARGKGVAKIYF